MICSPKLLQNITEFFANDYAPMLSDIHCAVTVSLKCQSNINVLYVAHNAAQPGNYEIIQCTTTGNYEIIQI